MEAGDHIVWQLPEPSLCSLYLGEDLQGKGALWVHCLREAPELFGENAELIKKIT